MPCFADSYFDKKMDTSLMMRKKEVTIEEMLGMVGEFKLFQWILDAMFCVMMIPSTLQVLIMYFAALNPPWKCVENSTMCLLNGTYSSENTRRCSLPRTEWEFTEATEYSIVTYFDIYCQNEWLVHLSSSIFFVGWVTGAVVLGWVADNFGRKNVIFPSMGMILFCGFITPFLPNIYLLILFRFVVGFFIPGTIVQMFVLASEMVGTKQRPLAAIILWLFFGVGLCALGLKAYYIRNWKHLFFVCTVPYILVLLFYMYIPESLRWLRLHGKTEKLMIIFEKIASWNKKTFPNDVVVASPPTDKNRRKSSPRELFQTTRIALKTLNLSLCWFATGLVYYGLSIAADDLGGSLYRNFVILSAVEIPAVVLCIDFSERFGRKKTTLCPMILGSIACFIIAFTPNEISKLILGMLGKFWFTMSLDVIYIWTVEMYPTSVRAEAMGFGQLINKLGAASAPWIAKGLKSLHEAAPFVVMSSIGLIASLLAFALPETRLVTMVETEEEATAAEREEHVLIAMDK